MGGGQRTLHRAVGFKSGLPSGISTGRGAVYWEDYGTKAGRQEGMLPGLWAERRKLGQCWDPEEGESLGDSTGRPAGIRRAGYWLLDGNAQP